MRDQPLERVRAAAEERERRAHVARRVVEGAAERHLLVVDPERVDLDAALPREAAEGEDGAAGSHELERELPRLGGAGRLDHDVGALAGAGLGAEERCERPPLRA